MHADLFLDRNCTSIKRSCILGNNSSVRLLQYFLKKHIKFLMAGDGDKIGWDGVSYRYCYCFTFYC